MHKRLQVPIIYSRASSQASLTNSTILRGLQIANYYACYYVAVISIFSSIHVESLKLDLLEKMEITRAKKSPILSCLNDVFNFEPHLIFNNLHETG